MACVCDCTCACDCVTACVCMCVTARVRVAASSPRAQGPAGPAAAGSRARLSLLPFGASSLPSLMTGEMPHSRGRRVCAPVSRWCSLLPPASALFAALSRVCCSNGPHAWLPAFSNGRGCLLSPPPPVSVSVAAGATQVPDDVAGTTYVPPVPDEGLVAWVQLKMTARGSCLSFFPTSPGLPLVTQLWTEGPLPSCHRDVGASVVPVACDRNPFLLLGQWGLRQSQSEEKVTHALAPQ